MFVFSSSFLSFFPPFFPGGSVYPLFILSFSLSCSLLSSMPPIFFSALARTVMWEFFFEQRVRWFVSLIYSTQNDRKLTPARARSLPPYFPIHSIHSSPDTYLPFFVCARTIHDIFLFSAGDAGIVKGGDEFLDDITFNHF
jgi:hypothetical protein